MGRTAVANRAAKAGRVAVASRVASTRDAVGQVTSVVARYRADIGSVSSWTDMSGHNHPLLQGTGGSQPTIVTNQINGFSVFRFNAKFMQTATFAFGQTMGIFMVARANAYGTGGVADIWGDGSTAGSMVIGSVIAGDQVSNGFSISAGSAMTYPQSVANNAFEYIGMIYLTGVGNGKIRVHGTQVQTGNPGAGAANGITLGALANGARGANFDVAEAVYCLNPSAADITTIETYFVRHYPSLLP